MHPPTPPSFPCVSKCSYASTDRTVIQQMSQVDAFGQMSSVALKVGERSRLGWLLTNGAGTAQWLSCVVGLLDAASLHGVSALPCQ